MLHHVLINRSPFYTSTLRSLIMPTFKRSTYSVAFVTVPSDAEAAKDMARVLIEKKLAACVNIVPETLSMYEWEGEIKVDEGSQLVIKTRTAVVDKLAEYIHANNCIDISEVVSVQIKGGNPRYLEWIGEKVPLNTKC